MTNARLLTALLLLSLCPALPSRAQPAPNPAAVEEIRQEMRQLQQDYDRRMKALEDRLNQLAPPPATATPAPRATVATTTNVPGAAGQVQDAVMHARQAADQQFRQTTEGRDRAIVSARSQPMVDRVEEVLNNFVEIGGYFRAGYGKNNEGGPQTAFQAPGALSKYRLGNEAENYGELVISKNFYTPGLFSLDDSKASVDAPDKPIAHLQIRGSAYNPYSNLGNPGDTEFGLPEAWASIGNVIPSQSTLKFWAGERFYRRHDIYISDFYFYNMSGSGAGAEDLKLPFGKMAFAWIGAGSESGVSDLPVPDAKNKAGFSKANYDLRLYEIPVPLGQGELGLTVARQDSGKDALGNQLDSENGFAVTFLHTREKFISEDGFNKFSLQYGRGPGKTLVSGFDYFTVNNESFIRPDPWQSWRFRATEHFVAQPWEHLAISPALVYQYTDFTAEYGGAQHWVSFGVRPIVQFTRNVSLALEPGVDWISDNDASRKGTLLKATIAPQVALGPGFFNRPVLRVYATYAHWPDSFKDMVGGQDFVGQTQGWSFGAQVEAWW